MKDEKFMGLSPDGQLIAGLYGGLVGYFGVAVENVIFEDHFCTRDQVVGVPPEDSTYTCTPLMKTAELASGSAILISAIFAAAAAGKAIKTFGNRKSRNKL